MIKRFLAKRKEKALEREMAKDPLVMLMFTNVKKNWHEVGILAQLSDEATEVHHTDFFSLIQNIIGADNVIAELRIQIINRVIAYSDNMTLVLTPEDKSLMFTKNSPYVTGEINQHIGQSGTSELTQMFKEAHFNHPEISPTDLTEIASLFMAINNFFIEGLDLLRIHLGDYNKINHSKDWLRPFQIAMAEIAEHEHRKKLGLPLLMEEMGWFKRSLFVNKVHDEANPLMAYEEAMKRVDKIDD